MASPPSKSTPPRPRRARKRARPHVALIIETSLAPGREILRGIARYVREHGPWSTFLEPRSLEETVPGWLQDWDGDGIIARVQNRQIAEVVRATRIPAVDVLGVTQPGGGGTPRRARPLPLVHTDDAQIAALAAEHLLEKGFRRFAFFGLAGESWSQQRRDSFARAVGAAGHPCAVYETPRDVHHTRMWEDYADDLARWVAGLDKPAGLMACSDQCGPVLLEACRRAGAAVPDAVAVIGVDNDEPLCEVSDPPLSSVWPDHFAVGYESAALLHRLMNGETPPPGPVYLAPRGVVTRQSTDVLAVEDRDVAAAVRFIRERACRGLRIDDVAEHVSLSRSALQRRFKSVVGRTIHAEALRVRLDRAKALLAGTELPIAVVAERAGFNHQEYMGAVFRQRLGHTPAEFRRRARSPGGTDGGASPGGAVKR